MRCPFSMRRLGSQITALIFKHVPARLPIFFHTKQAGGQSPSLCLSPGEQQMRRQGGLLCGGKGRLIRSRSPACSLVWLCETQPRRGGGGGNSKQLAVFLWSLKNKQGGRKNELKYVNEFRSGFYLKKKKKVRMFESLWKQQWIGLQAFLNSVAAIFSLSSTLSTNFRFPASA